MAILPASLPTLSKLSISFIRVSMPSLCFLLRRSVSITMTGSSGLPICYLIKMFRVKHWSLMIHSLCLRRKELIPVFQKALQALAEFLCEFVIGHPRIICSILGCLGALALISCVAAINILWR